MKTAQILSALTAALLFLPSSGAVAGFDPHGFAHWSLPAGATEIKELAFDTFILISNPGHQDTTVEIIYAGEAGEIDRFQRKIRARSRHTEKINNRITGPNPAVSTIVKSLDGVPVICERAMYWSPGGVHWAGGHNTLGIGETSEEWFFAEGATHIFDQFIHVVNPDPDQTAEVEIVFSNQDGVIDKLDKDLLPLHNWTVEVRDVAGGQTQVATYVHSRNGVPVAADRTMYWNSEGIEWEDGHASLGLPRPAMRWYLAEGATHVFDQYVMVYNPSETAAAAVTIEFMDQHGNVTPRQETVGPRSRYTVKVNDVVGSLPHVSTVVTADIPVAAERAMYWQGGGRRWGGGHGTVGAAESATVWDLPEGATHIFDQYVLVYNPSPVRTAVVTLAFMDDKGNVVNHPAEVAPLARFTVKVNDVVGRWNQVSTRVTSDIPVVAERAMYWPPGGGAVGWISGHGTAGFCVPTIFFGLPRTGQTEIHHGPGPFDSGDDGAVRAGFPLVLRRPDAFRDNGDGSVTDLATGLMWQKSDSAAAGFGNLQGALSWDDAFKYVRKMNEENFAGHSDWRVPNIKELSSLINMGTWLPAIYHIFSGMRDDQFYWSSTRLTDGVFVVLFKEAFIETRAPSDRFYVKAVRSHLPGYGRRGFPKTGQTTSYRAGDDGDIRAGYPLTGDRYTDHGDDTVTDNATGLMWRKRGSTAPRNWSDAFAYVADLNRDAAAGYDDWRMPNYIELVSLLDFGHWHPVINPVFEARIERYWSSSNRFGITPPNEAWAVHFSNAWGGNRPKAEENYVRAVRAGAVVKPTPPPPPSPTPFPVYGVPKTGQTTSYRAGDDGDFQIGYPMHGERFTDQGPTVIDNATGLMWQKAPGPGEKRTWRQAFAYVASLNQSRFAGHRDWRMPNIKELNTLVDAGLSDPPIPDIFELPPAGRDNRQFWSSTSFADLVNGHRGYQVDFQDGRMLFINMDDSARDSGHVRAVRSVRREEGVWGFPKTGQTNIIHFPSGYDLGDDGAVQAGYPASGPRFKDQGNGTVADRATGLIWSQSDSAYLRVGDYGGYLTWEEAFRYVEEMNKRGVGGYSSWRLPNYQELSSLFDYSQFVPVLDPIFQYSTAAGWHWTSTTRHGRTGQKWAILFTNGHGVWRHESQWEANAYVLAVMGGPGQDPGDPVPTPTPVFGPTPEWGPRPPQPPPTPPVQHRYYGLPKTGQISVYRQAGSNDMGDDGVTRIGYPEEGVDRWEDTGHGTVIDWATGLMWQKSCSFGETFGGLQDLMTWEEAFEYVARMNHARYGGHSDWRLPNVLEIASTRDLEHQSSDPDSLIHNRPLDPYWSSTCWASPGVLVYRLTYSYGQILVNAVEPTEIAAARAVRSFYNAAADRGFPRTGATEVVHPADGLFDLGDDAANQAGYPSTASRFTDHGQTVFDNATGLEWQKGSSASARNWQSAFDYVRSLNQQNFAGHNDWRLPNQMELYSILDFGEFDPAVADLFESGTPSNLFWSSNTQGDKDQTTNAWALNFLNGVGDIYPKTRDHYVRAVRGDPVIGGFR